MTGYASKCALMNHYAYECQLLYTGNLDPTVDGGATVSSDDVQCKVLFI